MSSASGESSTNTLPDADQNVIKGGIAPIHNSVDMSKAVECEAEPHRRWSIALAMVAFVISYMATSGPAVFLVEKLDLPMFTQFVTMLYSPLVLIIKLNVPILAPLLRFWVGLFR
ncbi:MAG: hypothetical protein KDA81_00900 [Planctomycetaceae bacterium]|nr:hypothetical protein [Planctomycetaceae bacterium]